MTSPQWPSILLAAAILAAQGRAGAQCGRSGASAPDPPTLQGPPPRPPLRAADDGPVTAGLARRDMLTARSLFEAGRFVEAAPLLERVASGDDGDDEGNRQIARYHLAIALYRLGLQHESLRVLGAVAASPSHFGRHGALSLLARIDADLGEPAGVADLVALYPPEEIAGYADPAQPDAHARLNHLLGWSAYRDRRYEVAILAFGQIGPESAFYLRSQLVEGVAFVMLRKRTLAVKAFLRLIDAAGKGDDEGRRLRDLGAMSIARALYSSAIHLDEPCAPTLDASALSASVRSWAEVPIGSELWPDAQLESSWAYFMAGDYARVLGNLHNLESGYFAATLYPEADILRGIVAFTLCRYDDVLTLVARMRLRYLPVRRALTALIARLAAAGRDEEVIAFHEQARAGRAQVEPPLAPFVEAAALDRPIRRRLDALRLLDAEQGRLDALPAAFRGSRLGKEAAAGIALARSTTLREGASRVIALYTRRLREIDAQLLDAQRLLVDATSAARWSREPGEALLASGEARSSGLPPPDHDHVVWPFDGEFWKDELGSYRQVVVSRCAR